MIWLFIYFWSSILIGLYGRISTLGLNDEENESEWKKFRRAFLRFFCLMDAFGLADTNKTWSRCKFVQFTLIFMSGIIFVTMVPIKGSGLLAFMGVVQLMYYGTNVLLNTKPRGLYYLWKSDMVALEFKEDMRQKSHVADMAHLSKKQLRKLASKDISSLDVFSEEEEEEDDQKEDKQDEEERALVVGAGQNEEDEGLLLLYDIIRVLYSVYLNILCRR